MVRGKKGRGGAWVAAYNRRRAKKRAVIARIGYLLDLNLVPLLLEDLVLIPLKLGRLAEYIAPPLLLLGAVGAGEEGVDTGCCLEKVKRGCRRCARHCNEASVQKVPPLVVPGCDGEAKLVLRSRFSPSLLLQLKPARARVSRARLSVSVGTGR